MWIFQKSAGLPAYDPDRWLKTHQPLDQESRADEVASNFTPLPFAVTRDGHLKLGPLCAAGGRVEFDDDGDPVIAVDFRNHISDLIVALGADPTPIVGATYPKLGYI